MTVEKILNSTNHRPWLLPTGQWKYYQEWNKAVFLHYQVEYEVLKEFVPKDLEIDHFDGKPWVSIVVFTMEKIRPRALPPFSPISNFDEINIRTYVKHSGKAGVYFLSIEAGRKMSCQIAKSLSGLPYRYSKLSRLGNRFKSFNALQLDQMEVEYEIGQELHDKTALDKWLTERYALFQDYENTLNKFEIHHIEWPIYKVNLKTLKVSYPKLMGLLSNQPQLAHYSTGVQVLAWGKRQVNG